MTRTIKFRAWDEKKKYMFYDGDTKGFNNETYPVSVTNKGVIYCPKGTWGKDNNVVDEDGNVGYKQWEFDRYHWEVELMQFTGIHDKNGKEIFENDLIKVNINVCVSGHAYTGDDEWIDVDYYAVVKFMPSKGFYGKVLRATNNIDDTEPRATKMVTIASYRTEVIGNIYSNPELAGRTE